MSCQQDIDRLGEKKLKAEQSGQPELRLARFLSSKPVAAAGLPWTLCPQVTNGAHSMNRCLVLLLIAVAACPTAAVLAEDGPAKDVPELQALSNYVGAWDVAITSDDSPFSKGESTTMWVLDGRFVQQTGVLKSADGAKVIKITTLMTYDSEQRTYRVWSFLSNGTTSEASGKWDEKTRTMTSTSKQNGTTTTTTAKFSDNGVEEWLFVTTNQNNEVVGRFGGTNKRRKQ